MPDSKPNRELGSLLQLPASSAMTACNASRQQLSAKRLILNEKY
jgi:hypothetical protein